MKAIIKESVIKTNNLRKGFFVKIEDHKFLIKEVNRDTKEAFVSKIILSDNGIEFEEPIAMPIEDLLDKVLRYSAQVGDTRPKVFDLSYRDYPRAIDGLTEEVYTIKEPRNAKEQDLVRITDIEIIDPYGLYEVETRKGVIVDMEVKRNREDIFHIRLETKDGSLGKTLKCKRESFSLRDSNYHILAHIKCSHCEF